LINIYGMSMENTCKVQTTLCELKFLLEGLKCYKDTP